MKSLIRLFVSIRPPIAKGMKPGVGIQLGKQDPPW